jgi:3-oxoacyl-[acyl-carrier-protein] synthase II
MKHPICISGMGIVSPIGTGKEDYWNALASGKNGVSPVDLFDCSELKSKSGAQVDGFDAASLLGSKGLKYIDRPSRFATAASSLAMQDATIPVEEHHADKLGIVLGTGFGSSTSQKELNRERVLEGAKWVSPLKFPSTPLNASTYHIPIRYRMRFINATISCGIISAMEAIRYSMFLLQNVPDAILLSGGVDELSYWTYHSSYFLKELAGISGEEISCPFDATRNGYILGEGCALLALETLGSLRDRGGKTLARIAGFGSNFTPANFDQAKRVEALSHTIRLAIQGAGIQPEEIDAVFASANSGKEIDKMEANAIFQAFGNRALPVTAIKSMIGETFAASGALQIAAAVMSLQRGILPPTINLRNADFPLNIITETAGGKEIRYVLVNSIDLWGNSACMVLASTEMGRADPI